MRMSDLLAIRAYVVFTKHTLSVELLGRGKDRKEGPSSIQSRFWSMALNWFS